MSYLFNTPERQAEMLQTIGVSSIDELFGQVPESLRLRRDLNLPAPLAEVALEDHLRRLAGQNVGGAVRSCFLGGGVYDHFVPAAIDEIAARGEFYTAYTPYQAEASQGSLQAFFEYQTLICQLTGMDVSNASLYEGGTSVSEAVFMAMRVTRRHDKIVVLGSIHPEYHQVLATHLQNVNCEIQVVPLSDGVADLSDVEAALDERTACLVFQNPNFFGCLESVRQMTEVTHRCGALAVSVFDPISLGLLDRPGNYGADIAVAEGQALGIPMQFGGPFLGILACRKDFVRQMPGRLIGQTVDRQGRRCFVLNLQAREQHIRREKATSNICTNQGLMALRAAIFLSLVGGQGLRELADLCCRKAHYAADKLSKIRGIGLMFDRPFFKEFVLRCDDVDGVISRAREAGCDVGPSLKRFPALKDDAGTELTNGVLIAVTEKRTREEIDRLADALNG